MTDLKEIARQVRILTLQSIHASKAAHPGGSLSMVEIIAILHCEVMQPQPYHPDHARDIFVLSAGHKVPSLYSLWGVLGWVDPAAVLTLRQLGSPFQGHPSYLHFSWLHCSSGSLGIAFSEAVGMALGRKLTGQPGTIFVLIGDGEAMEGIVTEASRLAVHFELDNLCVILDRNGKSSDEHSIMLVKAADEAIAWGFEVAIADGHNFDSLREAFAEARETWGQPTLIIAETKKGKGIAQYESDPSGGHGSLSISDQELETFLKELEG